jgi:hypothetical protein
MPMMVSPDGTETQFVPDSLVAHVQSLGGTVAAQPSLAERVSSPLAVVGGLAADAVGGVVHLAAPLLRPAAEIGGAALLAKRFLRSGGGAPVTTAVPAPEPPPPPAPPGSVESRASGGPTRPISVIRGGKAQPAKAPAPTAESPGAGRGASGPELARRAEARARVKIGSPQARTAAAVGEAPASDLEAQLASSIEAAQAARGISATATERAAIMNGLRGLAPPALQAILTLVGAGNTGSDIQAAHELYMRSRYSPSELRALAGPTGS